MTAIGLTVAYHESGASVQCSREAFAAWMFGDDWDTQFISWRDFANAYCDKVLGLPGIAPRQG
jgi:hypothetical protein